MVVILKMFIKVVYALNIGWILVGFSLLLMVLYKLMSPLLCSTILIVGSLPIMLLDFYVIRKVKKEITDKN